MTIAVDLGRKATKQTKSEAALQGSVIAICLEQLTDSSALLCQWLALCLAKVWTNFSCLVLQEAALQGSVIAICLEQLTDSSALLRQWLALCLAKVWTNFDNARWCGVRDSAHEKLYKLLTDTHPEVTLRS